MSVVTLTGSTTRLPTPQSPAVLLVGGRLVMPVIRICCHAKNLYLQPFAASDAIESPLYF